MTLFRRLALTIFLAAPTLATALWATWPTLQAWLATRQYAFPKMSAQDWDDSARTTELRRRLQRHFLNHNVYIPLDDIVVTGASETEPNELAALMQRACGRGRLFVWIPLKFRVPIRGEQVIEWCWKPLAAST